MREHDCGRRPAHWWPDPFACIAFRLQCCSDTLRADEPIYHREFSEDEDVPVYFVLVNWLVAVTLDQAIAKIGLFGNQNTVYKPTTPRWRLTVERLKSDGIWINGLQIFVFCSFQGSSEI